MRYTLYILYIYCVLAVAYYKAYCDEVGCDCILLSIVVIKSATVINVYCKLTDSLKVRCMNHHM